MGFIINRFFIYLKQCYLCKIIKKNFFLFKQRKLTKSNWFLINFLNLLKCLMYLCKKIFFQNYMLKFVPLSVPGF